MYNNKEHAKSKKERKWICCYINSKGDERQKIFIDVEEGLEFIHKLDGRIEKGTCWGYTFTEI